MAGTASVTSHALQVVLAKAQQKGRLPSVVAAVSRDGAPVWRGTHGSETGHDHPSGPDLQYRIGSITKTLTAVSVLQLREEGRLDLSDPVGVHLPEVERPGVTLRGLLSHDAGLAAEPPGPWWERSAGRSFADLVTALAGSPPAAPAGVAHHYSNVGFALLGEVVARLSGESWWERVATRILTPLGMQRTTYHPAAPHAQGWSVHPYAGTLEEEPATDTGAMAPAGQLWSTAADLARYADFLLAGHREVLDIATLEEMSTPQGGTAADGLGSGYGLGLRLIPGGSGTLVGHTGSMPGFQTSLFVDRPRRVSVVVLANATTGLDTDAIAPGLLAELERWEPTVPAAWKPSPTVPGAVADILGVWHWGNTARVLSWDGSLLGVSAPGSTSVEETYAIRSGGLIGVEGYHRGEPLLVVRRQDGSVSHLEVSTFVLTRTPYGR